ncbi:MAG: DUF4149 domain-containing protein [Gemmatimonadota bacterium]|nr:DUF4149 domain-containing protein [Gemmatimonadota bacterium]
MSRSLAALVLAALWLGASLITITVVAPGAFAVLPTRAMAGDMVGRVLPVVFGSAIAVHLVVLLVAPLVRRHPLAAAAAVIAALAAAGALFGVDPRIAALRAAIVVPIDQLPPGDPRRAMFGLLHAISVGLLGVAMLANAGLLVVLSRAIVGRAPSSGEPR